MADLNQQRCLAQKHIQLNIFLLIRSINIDQNSCPRMKKKTDIYIIVNLIPILKSLCKFSHRTVQPQPPSFQFLNDCLYEFVCIDYGWSILHVSSHMQSMVAVIYSSFSRVSPNPNPNNCSLFLSLFNMASWNRMHFIRLHPIPTKCASWFVPSCLCRLILRSW